MLDRRQQNGHQGLLQEKSIGAAVCIPTVLKHNDSSNGTYRSSTRTASDHSGSNAAFTWSPSLVARRIIRFRKLRGQAPQGRAAPPDGVDLSEHGASAGLIGERVYLTM